MRYLTYLRDGEAELGVLSSDGANVYSVAELGFEFDSMLSFIEASTPQLMGQIAQAVAGAADGTPLKEVRLLAPIPYPRRDWICIGENYIAHAKESAAFKGIAYTPPTHPTIFSKRVQRALGPGEAFPSHRDITDSLDYEAELAVIIGKECSQVSEAEVPDYIFGYTIANDLSARDLQGAYRQFYFGKGLDGFAVMGPWIVTADEIAYPPALQISSSVNGEPRQNDRTDSLIFGISRIISELSYGITLYPGEVLLTGTPSGVGMGFNPPKFLNPGDSVTCRIEGIGVLENSVQM